MEDKVNWGYWNFWLRYSQGSTQWLGKAAQKRAWNNKFYIKSSHQCQVLILTQNILWQKNWTDWAVLDYFSQISRTRVFCQDDLQWLGSYRLPAQHKSRKWIKVENCFVFLHNLLIFNNILLQKTSFEFCSKHKKSDDVVADDVITWVCRWRRHWHRDRSPSGHDLSRRRDQM